MGFGFEWIEQQNAYFDKDVSGSCVVVGWVTKKGWNKFFLEIWINSNFGMVLDSPELTCEVQYLVCTVVSFIRGKYYWESCFRFSITVCPYAKRIRRSKTKSQIEALMKDLENQPFCLFKRKCSDKRIFLIENLSPRFVAWQESAIFKCEKINNRNVENITVDHFYAKLAIFNLVSFSLVDFFQDQK